MADTRITHEIVTRRYEGLYDDDPIDPGGETAWGLTRKAEAHWEGWKLLDVFKAGLKNLPADHDARVKVIRVALHASPLAEQLRELAFPLYDKKYYTPLWLKQFNDQALANKYGDTAVLGGVETTIGMMEDTFQLPKTFKMSQLLLNRINASV